MDISKMSIAEIKATISDEIIAKNPEYILRLLANDARAGVRQIYLSYQKRRAAIEKENQRLRRLLKYERELWENGFSFVAGVDEAGRGPLAGPVIAAAVILQKGIAINGLNDSKKLSPVQRSEIEDCIREKAVAISVGIVSESEIDEINIYQASLKAMHQAVVNLSRQADFLLVDAVRIPGTDIPQRPIIHGDALSHSIAAASIIAKETRDRFMVEYDKKYPQYGFARHKGYGTPEHLAALKKYGPCPIHRKSFGQIRQNNT